MPSSTLFDRVWSLPGFSDRIEATRHYPPTEATYAEPAEQLHPKIAERLAELGLSNLYSHQAKAFDEAALGRDVVVQTGTSSGKTLCYALPILQRCVTEPACRSLILYPTKALAQDQLARLEALTPAGEARLGVYDGDTPTAQRGPMRRLANVLLSNPDMLHVGILPRHEYWSSFFRSLRFVVLDELHAYRGVFGSHVAGVLRRLLRLCEWHGSRPQILACSATVANPVEHFGRLTGRLPTLVDEDGAPSGPKTVALYNPPADEQGNRLSANLCAANLLAAFAEEGLRSLAFSRARISAELVLRYARQRLEERHGPNAAQIESYRGGYTPAERRAIEKALFDGALLGLSTTNAMELGVDVGGLDAAILNGYPGTIASFWQQAGRAGRGTREGIAVLVAHDDPLEQFLIREPAMLLDRPTEPIAVNPENPIVLAQQLRCAAFERALAPTEVASFGESAVGIAEEMDRAGELEFRAGRFYLPSHDSPASGISIRGIGSDSIALYVEGVELGSMERWRALQYAHAGAVYLHRGESYLVLELDLERRRANLERLAAPYYTQPMVQAVVESRVAIAEGPWGSSEAALCGLSVTEQVIGFKRKSLDGDRVLSVEDLDLPPSTFDTVGIRFALDGLDVEDPAGQASSLHALEHALTSVAPFLAGCDRGDLGSAWYAVYPDDLRPTVFIYDRAPGGVGLSDTLFDSRASWAHAAGSLLTSCPCSEGCPACLLSPRCEVSNEGLSKPGAISILESLRS